MSTSIKWNALKNITPYNTGIELMEKKVGEVIDHKSPETIFLLEHPHIYTAGTGAEPQDLIEQGDCEIYKTGRGGKYTYHGPGQRIIYPILNLSLPHREKDLRKYISDLEDWIIATLNRLKVTGYKIPGQVGIWVNIKNKPHKIAAIGVRVKKWVTYHGIAINVNPDLNKFSGIIPCGINSCGITSLEKLGIDVAMKELDKILQEEFQKIFLG